MTDVMRILIASLLAALSLLSSILVHAADHAVILVYHHVSDETPTSTSISPSRFREQLQYLEDNAYHVAHLGEVLEALTSGKPVPDNTVVFTFDDAYLSVYQQAAPLLEEHGWPYTVFVASDYLDRGFDNYLSWQLLRELRQRGASIGGHSLSHAHLTAYLEGESEIQWRRRVSREIDGNLERILAKTGEKATAFAYPYGEYDADLKRLLQRRNLFGLVQHSGAMGFDTDPQQIPRFPIAGGFDDMRRFVTAINSRPLPVRKETLLTSATAPRTLELSLAGSAAKLSQLGCYSATGESLQVETQVASPGEGRVRVSLPETRAGRNKINCTLPGDVSRQEYFWYSYLWMGE